MFIKTQQHNSAVLIQSRPLSRTQHVVVEKKKFNGPRFINTTPGFRTTSSVDRDINQSRTVIINNDEYVYKGQTKMTLKDGIGVLFNRDAQIIYEGEWKDDKYHGKGILKYYDHSQAKQYIGEFLFGLKHGAGIEFNLDGSYYVGNFVKNQKSGVGTLYGPNDNILFTGFWELNQPLEPL